MWRLKWLILWSLWATRVVRQPTAPVLVSNGWVRGSVAPRGNYIQYVGIPFATVVGRFQAPGPEPKWDGIFDAVTENIRCIQMTRNFEGQLTHGPESVIGREDCLILNIYTPVTSSGPLPVMVFIHGGAYVQGSSEKMVFGPEYLMGKGVILVTINYRLNVQGFLCLGIKEAPGNAAMKDQVAALRWVQRNIKAFGGDPDNVTLFGESAGSASASIHLLSPMTKGLFHKSIQQSGSSTASWAVQRDPIENAYFKAKAVGYTGTSKDPHELYKFFSTKTDLEIITRLTERVEGNTVQTRTLFTACVEKKLDGVEAFLTEKPSVLLREGRYNKVPTIIGANTAEGIMFLAMEPEHCLSNVTFGTMMPMNLVYPNAEVKSKIEEDLTKLYMGDDKISVETKEKFGVAYSEFFFNYPAIEESELIARTSDQPIFSYLFNYQGWRNFAKFSIPGDLKHASGAAHADELFYLFSQELTPTLFEGRMIEIMTTMWTNFAKFGDPTPEVTPLLPVKWPALTLDDPRSLVIDHKLTTKPLWYNNSTLPYLHDIFAKYRRKG